MKYITSSKKNEIKSTFFFFTFNKSVMTNSKNIEITTSQIFGDKQISIVFESDRITSIKFNKSSKLLAIGDGGGRIILFSRGNSGLYSFIHEFQSHQPEFDYLKSLEIAESINEIEWLPKICGKSDLLLSTNDKTIKLWKILKDEESIITNLNSNSILEEVFTVPKISLKTKGGDKYKNILSQSFINGHSYHIHSISLCPDQATFISSDNLRINIWNLDIPGKSYCIVDIKPSDVSLVNKVISCAKFHPICDGIFLYSTSTGEVYLGDLRTSSNSLPIKTFFDTKASHHGDILFTEIFKNISDISFSPSGRYFCTRDFTSLKVWDLQMDTIPIATMKIHDFEHNILCDLYEMDYVFDSFSCVFGNNDLISTGSYDGHYYIYDWKESLSTLVDVSEVINNNKMLPSLSNGINRKLQYNTGIADFSRKINTIDWNNELLAIGSTNMLYLMKSSL